MTAAAKKTTRTNNISADIGAGIDTDICIVGGGLTGLMMAVSLSHTGYQVAILDRSDGSAPPTDGRTTTIHAAGMKMLTALGIAEHLSISPTPIMGIQVAAGEPATGLQARKRRPFDLEWMVPDTPPGSPKGSPMGFVVDNGDLFAALSGSIAARNITHMTGTTIMAMHSDAGRATLDAELGAELDAELDTKIHCDLVVGCDGGQSPLRQASRLRQISESQLPNHQKQTAIVAVMRVEQNHKQTAYQRFLPGGPLALMPLSGRMMSLVWTLKDAEAERLIKMDEDEFNSECTRAFGPALGFLSLDGARLKWPLSPAITPVMTRPNLALAGDAAHALHPLAGQGYNLALGDAAVLADALVKARQRGLAASHSSVLQDYTDGRRTEVAAMASITSGLNLLFADRSAGFAGLLSAGMEMVNATPLKSVFSNVARGGSLADAALLRGDLPG